MAERNKKDETDYETWLLNFEKQVGKPVVVSLLIERGKVEFINCVNRKHCSFAGDDGSDAESPDIDLEEAKKKDSVLCLKHQESGLDYIG